LMNPRWYRATQAQLIMGSYRLQYPDGQEVPNSWNIEHLRHFHPWSTEDILYWCLEMHTSSTILFYWFTTSTTR
jgi:hypothetical protein